MVHETASPGQVDRVQTYCEEYPWHLRQCKVRVQCTMRVVYKLMDNRFRVGSCFGGLDFVYSGTKIQLVQILRHVQPV